MTSYMRRSAIALCTAAMLVGGTAGSATAQVQQDGLVNVNVGDVTVFEDVNVGIAANIAAQVCGVKVGPVAVLGRAVDRSGTTETVCESDQGPVTLSQN